MTWFQRRKRTPPPLPVPPRPGAAPASPGPAGPSPTGPDAWRIGEWDRPDLEYAKAHAEPRYRAWDRWVPNLELVRCGEKVKPALFFKTGYAEVGEWAATVEPVSLGWNWFRPKDPASYVVVELHVEFVNRSGASIGVGGEGQATAMTVDAERFSHQLRTRTLLDPGDQGHRRAIEAWAAAPAPTMLFFVDEHGRGTSYVSMDLGPAGKQSLLRVLAEATEELGGEGIARGGFADACAALEQSLPPVSWWRD